MGVHTLSINCLLGGYSFFNDSTLNKISSSVIKQLFSHKFNSKIKGELVLCEFIYEALVTLLILYN